MTSDQSEGHPVASYPDGDYEAILSAVTETARGRWFLAEHERRHRGAETSVVVEKLVRLEKLLQRERRPDADRIKLDIGEMKDAIERTKLEISQIKVDRKIGSRFIHASNELDAIVTQTEAATSEILSMAEKIQELAFEARENGVDAEFCDKLEEYTTTIYLGCSFQDLTGQRTQKVVHVLRFLESRIDSMIDIWGMDAAEVEERAVSTTANPLDTRPDAHLLNGPQMEGEGVAQNAIDDLMEFGSDDTDINSIDFDSIDFDSVASDEDDNIHHSHVLGQPETQEEVDELFADAAFEREEAAAEAEEAIPEEDALLNETNRISLAEASGSGEPEHEDVLAMLDPKERRALFS